MGYNMKAGLGWTLTFSSGQLLPNNCCFSESFSQSMAIVVYLGVIGGCAEQSFGWNGVDKV